MRLIITRVVHCIGVFVCRCAHVDACTLRPFLKVFINDESFQSLLEFQFEHQCHKGPCMLCVCPHFHYLSMANILALLACEMRFELHPSMFCRTMQVLQEDFTKCHIHSHLISLGGCQKSLDGESRYAKVRTLPNLYTFLYCVTGTYCTVMASS